MCYRIDQLAVVHRLDHLGHLDELFVGKGCWAEVPFLVKDVTRDLLTCGFLQDIDDGEAGFGIERCNHWVEIIGFGVLHDVHTIVVEISENGMIYQLFVGDTSGLDGVIGIVVVLIVGAVFLDELEALGQGVILPTAIFTAE